MARSASLARVCDHAPSQRAREPRDGTTAPPTPLPARERGTGARPPDGTQTIGSPRPTKRGALDKGSVSPRAHATAGPLAPATHSGGTAAVRPIHPPRAMAVARDMRHS